MGNTNPDCPICQNKSEPIYAASDLRQYQCVACKLAFVHPLPTESYLEEYYSKFHKTDDQGGMYDFAEKRMSEDFSAKIDLMNKHLTNPISKILDVGCGKGFFVKQLNENGYTSVGIDLSNTAIEFAKNVLQVNALLGRVESADIDSAPFDGVTFWATIEHVPEPLQTLKGIHSKLKPNGLLFMDTGIGGDWLDKLLPGVNQWYDPPQHLYVFSADSITSLLNAAGFEIVHLDTNFDRTRFRRFIRVFRGFVAAAGFRAIAEITRTSQKSNEFGQTKFPLGNLMFIVARRL